MTESSSADKVTVIMLLKEEPHLNHRSVYVINEYDLCITGGLELDSRLHVLFIQRAEL